MFNVDAIRHNFRERINVLSRKEEDGQAAFYVQSQIFSFVCYDNIIKKNNRN